MEARPSPSRRSLVRAAAVTGLKVATITSVPLAFSSKAQAAGRHSSLADCITDLFSPPPVGQKPVCFLKGTRIATAEGLKEIENLHIGDLVLTHGNSYQPIKWIGYMAFKKAPDEAWLPHVAPVQILRSAIQQNVPERDLYLSQEHALFDGEVLIPVKYLVNGKTIRVVAPQQSNELEYLHLEFDEHQVIYAEGTAAESFFATNQREWFSNFAEFGRLYGSDNTTGKAPYAPVCRYRRRDNAVAISRIAITALGIDMRDRTQILHDILSERAHTAQN